MLPMPPTITMATTLIDSWSWMLEAKMDPTSAAEMAPARPAKPPPSMYASSFVWTRLTPIPSATSSSSRTAIHDRPSRDPRRRQATKATTAAQARAM